jgi:hypothetical protein
MLFTAPLIKLRQRKVWADPYRKYRTLLSFSETEEDGGKDLVRAGRRVSDPDLRKHIERHSTDEVRHADLFRRRAAEVASENNIPIGGTDGGADKRYDLAGARKGVDVDAHGFMNAGLIDELGELEYVAMVHVAECKAAELFAIYRDMNARDAATKAIFEEILKDEKYHVAYTKTFLDKWRKQGRGAEIDKALKKAKGSRLMGAWKAFGLRSASGFAHVVLFTFYWTLLAPFGLLSRGGKGAGGWRKPRIASSPALKVGQY